DGTRPAKLSRLTLRMAEDHPTADRLEDSHDGHRKLGADMPRAILDDDHRPVFEVPHRLGGLLALLDHADRDLLTRKDDRTNRLREIVDVQHGDALERCDPVQAVV